MNVKEWPKRKCFSVLIYDIGQEFKINRF